MHAANGERCRHAIGVPGGAPGGTTSPFGHLNDHDPSAYHHDVAHFPRTMDLNSIASVTLVIAGFLVVISIVQPAAERLHLPYTVLLAFVGVAVGGAVVVPALHVR